MLKRATWAITGYAAGIASSIWATRKAKAMLRKSSPQAVLHRASGRIDRTKQQLVASIEAGRVAAEERERSLRMQIDRTPRQNVR